MESTSPILFLLHVAGAAALLIWAVRLVRTGVERGWSVQLRRWLRKGDDNRIMAALSGMVAASIAGSWVGTRLRHLVPQINFLRLFRWMVTLLALRMIALPVMTL